MPLVFGSGKFDEVEIPDLACLTIVDPDHGTLKMVHHALVQDGKVVFCGFLAKQDVDTDELVKTFTLFDKFWLYTYGQRIWKIDQEGNVLSLPNEKTP